MSPITGTGSKVSALSSAQHKSPGETESIASGPLLFTDEVPCALLQECETTRAQSIVNSVRKATNLYRRVSTVNYRNTGLGKVNTCKSGRGCNAKCLVCLVTLVKSSKDKRRSGVKIRCDCNVRVCMTCFTNNPEWHMTEPHFGNCPILRTFICSTCGCFQGVKVRMCCTWMCTSCASHRTSGACSRCPRVSGRTEKRVTRTLWSSNVYNTDDVDDQPSVDHREDAVLVYRDLLRARVLERVSLSRHLSAVDARVLFQECFTPKECTCKIDDAQTPMCSSCTPVLTLLDLLSRRPLPLIASLPENAIPGRVLARNVYDRRTLTSMLNDPDLPLCSHGDSCKGMLIKTQTEHPKALPCLLSPESYKEFVANKVQLGQVPRVIQARCILCLLFNQSSAVAQMLSSHSLYTEPHPSGPVYYFNLKLCPDVGVPEIHIENYQGYLVNFQGSVGSYKPTFYYNWRDMLVLLHRDKCGKLIFSPAQ